MQQNLVVAFLASVLDAEKQLAGPEACLGDAQDTGLQLADKETVADKLPVREARVPVAFEPDASLADFPFAEQDAYQKIVPSGLARLGDAKVVGSDSSVAVRDAYLADDLSSAAKDAYLADDPSGPVFPVDSSAAEHGSAVVVANAYLADDPSAAAVGSSVVVVKEACLADDPSGPASLVDATAAEGGSSIVVAKDACLEDATAAVHGS